MKQLTTLLSLAVLIWFSGCRELKPALSFGTYYGTFPCADCSGIQYKLTLNQDSTYLEQLLYADKGDTIENKGAFTVMQDSIIKLKDKSRESGMQFFAFRNESLTMLNKNKQSISSGFKNQYRLTKSKPSGFSFVTNEKEDNLIAFKANGNEPFWGLKIDYNQKISFQTIDSHKIEIQAPLTTPVKPTEKDTVTWEANSEEGSLQITVVNSQCKDDMSGKSYTHSVAVKVKTSEMEAYKHYGGCGSFRGDYRLNDIWLLEQINGKTVSGQSRTPYIEIHLFNERLFGFASCNRFNGKVALDSSTIKIGPMISTRMACPDMTLEDQLLDILNDNAFTFEIGNRQLTLKNNKNSLTFKKVD